MICQTCEDFFKSTIEMSVFRDERLPMQRRRGAAIKVLGMARRRKATKWPAVSGAR